jgi:hypothetical protein
VLFGIVPKKQFLPFFFCIGGKMYRFEAVSIEGLIQQIAVSYIVNGYWYYVTGRIPEDKTVEAVDAKLIDRYRTDRSKYARARRKRKGLGNVQYIRYRRFFVLLATKGTHRFFDEESTIRDFRLTVLCFGGYSVGCWTGDGKSHPSVRIRGRTYRELKAYFRTRATIYTVEKLIEEFRSFAFAPYGPIKRQIRCLFRLVNRKRKAAGMELLREDEVSLRRTQISPFAQSPKRVLENSAEPKSKSC